MAFSGGLLRLKQQISTPWSTSVLSLQSFPPSSAPGVSRGTFPYHPVAIGQVEYRASSKRTDLTSYLLFAALPAASMVVHKYRPRLLPLSCDSRAILLPSANIPALSSVLAHDFPACGKIKVGLFACFL